MLILLSERFRGRVESLVKEHGSRFLEPMANVAIGYRSGKHIVSGSVTIMNELIEHLTGDARGDWKDIKKKAAYLGSLRSQVSHVCVVEPFESGAVQIQKHDEQIAYHVPYSFFCDVERVMSSRLVVEDQNDALVYQKAAQGYLQIHENLKAVCIALRSFGGGGMNLANAFREHAQCGFTVSIADTDKKWPDMHDGEMAPEGQTLRRLRAVHGEIDSAYVCHVVALPCHELENILPAALVRDAMAQEETPEQLRIRFAMVDNLELFGATAPFGFIDIKKGFHLRDIHDAKPALKSYLRTVQEESRRRAPSALPSFCNEDAPQCTKRDECHCIIVAGLGDHVLGFVAKQIEKTSPKKIAEYFFSPKLPCRDDWQNICRQIVSFGCALPRRRL